MWKGWTIAAVLLAICCSGLVLGIRTVDSPLPAPVRPSCDTVISVAPDVRFSATGRDVEPPSARVRVDEIYPSQKGRIGRRVALIGVFHIEFELANVYTTQRLWFRLVDPDHTDRIDSTVLLSLAHFGPGESYFVEHQRSLGDRCAVVEGIYDVADVQAYPRTSIVTIGSVRSVERLSIWSAPRFPVVTSPMLKMVVGDVQ